MPRVKMKLTNLLVYTALAVSLSTLTVTAAPETSDNPAPLPEPTKVKISGVVKGTVKAMLGHSYGYVPPQEGQEFELDLSSLGQIKNSLDFEPGKEHHSYIPVSGPFSIVDIRELSVNGNYSWRSFEAVSGKEGGHKVTLQISKFPGRGNPNFVAVWIIVEAGDRIWGVCEIEGLFIPSQTKND